MSRAPLKQRVITEIEHAIDTASAKRDELLAEAEEYDAQVTEGREMLQLLCQDGRPK